MNRSESWFSDSCSQAPSPYDEGAVHDSFHQLIQEQSWLAEQELVEMQEITNVTSRGKGESWCLYAIALLTEQGEIPGSEVGGICLR